MMTPITQADLMERIARDTDEIPPAPPLWAVAMLMTEHDAGPWSLRRRERVAVYAVRAGDDNEAVRVAQELAKADYPAARGWLCQDCSFTRVDLRPNDSHDLAEPAAAEALPQLKRYHSSDAVAPWPNTVGPTVADLAWLRAEIEAIARRLAAMEAREAQSSRA